MTDCVKHLIAKGASFFAEMIEESTDGLSTVEFESPIEKLFASALMVVMNRRCPSRFSFHPAIGETLDGIRRRAGLDGDPFALSPCPGRWLAAAPQVVIGSFRVDFLILSRSGLDGVTGLAIECDGHEFHEKTKEQAARDKARDRELSALGHRVVRFTGSEIWRDPFRCADDVFDLTYHNARTSCEAASLLASGDTEAALQELSYLNRIGSA